MSKDLEQNFPDLIKQIVEGMEDIKAHGITVMDMRELENSVTDFFVICQGTSTTQVKSISDAIEKRVREELDDRPWHIEGEAESNWVLLDYVSAVAHVFLDDQRKFYDLEGLWGDAQTTVLSKD